MATLAAPSRTMGRYERLAYERHERMLALAGGPDTKGVHPKGYWFDSDAAEWSVEFLENRCRHHKGEWAGQPLILEEHQRFSNRYVFGWKKADGTRLVQTAYEEVPRKNGKTEKAGGIALLLTVADEEPGAEVYAAATKEDQAKIVWDVAKQMVRQDGVLRDMVTIRQKTLSCEELGSFFRPLGADSDTLDGLNPHGIIVDELHAHKNRGLWDVLDTAKGSRRQPLTWAITTAGIYDPESIGWQIHEHAVKVLEGAIEDDSFFAIIFAADLEDDWESPETWAKANPNLGVSLKESYLATQCEKAKQQPAFLNTFLRLHLNRWTQQVTRWIPIEQWNKCGGEKKKIDVASLAKRACYGGLDLGSTTDICALTLAFPLPEYIALLFRFWCPEDTIMKRSKEDRVPYDAWVRDGFMTATPGNATDYDFIEADILTLKSLYDIKELAFDPWNASQLTTHLTDKGLTMVEMRQGFASLSGPSKEFERRIMTETLRHGDHPVMRWMVSNVTVKEDPAGNIKPDKSTAIGRIDGVVSTIMALGRTVVQAVPNDAPMFLGIVPRRRH